MTLKGVHGPYTFSIVVIVGYGTVDLVLKVGYMIPELSVPGCYADESVFLAP